LQWRGELVSAGVGVWDIKISTDIAEGFEINLSLSWLSTHNQSRALTLSLVIADMLTTTGGQNRVTLSDLLTGQWSRFIFSPSV